MTCGQRMKETPVLFDVFQGPVESSVGIYSDIRGFPGCKSRRTLWPCVYIHGNPGIDRMGNETSSLRRDEFGHVVLGVRNVDPDRNSHIPDSHYTAPFYGPSHMWFHPLLNHCFWGVFNIEMGFIFILPTIQQYKWGFYMFQLCFLQMSVLNSEYFAGYSIPGTGIYSPGTQPKIIPRSPRSSESGAFLKWGILKSPWLY